MSSTSRDRSPKQVELHGYPLATLSAQLVSSAPRRERHVLGHSAVVGKGAQRDLVRQSPVLRRLRPVHTHDFERRVRREEELVLALHTTRSYSTTRTGAPRIDATRNTAAPLNGPCLCERAQCIRGLCANTPSDLDVRRRDEVDIVAATHEVELNPPQHARVDRIGEDHLNPMRSQHAMGIAAHAHAHLCANTTASRTRESPTEPDARG